MSRPAGSDRAEEEYSSALFCPVPEAGRYSAGALPTDGSSCAAPPVCGFPAGCGGAERRLDVPERNKVDAETTGGRNAFVVRGTICRIGGVSSSIRRGSSPCADRFGGRCGPPVVKSGRRQKLLFFLADLPFVACGRDRSGCDRMKSAARDDGLPHATCYAGGGTDVKKRRPREGAVKSECRSYYCWLRMRIAASRIVVSSSVTTPPSGPCSTWMPTFPLAS